MSRKGLGRKYTSNCKSTVKVKAPSLIALVDRAARAFIFLALGPNSCVGIVNGAVGGWPFGSTAFNCGALPKC